MSKYCVKVEEHYLCFVEVEADSEREALESVEETRLHSDLDSKMYCVRRIMSIA